MEKQKFDNLTDLVEHAQQTQVESETSLNTEREVENAQGEKITLSENR